MLRAEKAFLWLCGVCPAHHSGDKKTLPGDLNRLGATVCESMHTCLLCFSTLTSPSPRIALFFLYLSIDHSRCPSINLISSEHAQFVRQRQAWGIQYGMSEGSDIQSQDLDRQNMTVWVYESDRES